MMKKIIILSLFAFAFLVSCKEKDLVDNSEQVGRSKITYYPIMTVKGDLFMTLAKGASFTDPGATAVAGTEQATVVTTGSVDPNTVGTYSLTYTATNKDGFSTVSSRVVGIYDPSIVANDFSGSYARSTNGSLAVWTKVAPGLYTVNNPGGAPGTDLTIHAFNLTGFIITVPSQTSSDGSITECTNASGGADIAFDPATKSYAWHVVNAGYGPSLRTFTKQ